MGVFLSVLAALLSLSVLQASDVKLISLGFSSPTPRLLRENLPLMEQYLPGDGTVIFIDHVAPDGRLAHRHSLFRTGWRWEKSWFASELEDLKAIRSRKLTDNFLSVAVTGHTFNFFDDKAWDCVFHNIGIWTELAREGGLKGFLFDTEYYNLEKVGMFQYDPESGRSFREYAEQGRRRGRQFMKVIGDRFPDITIIALFGFGHNFQSVQDPDRIEAALAGAQYGLLPAFLNGMMDALPPKATLLDGTEMPGYVAQNHHDYTRMVSDFYHLTPRLCAPENLAKLFSQSGLALPLYLNTYIRTEGFWVVKHKTMDRMKLLRRNLRDALEYSRGYVWMYYDALAKFYPCAAHERYEAILRKKGGGKASLYSELLPKLHASVEAARNPEGYALQQVKKGLAVPVLRDDFEGGMKLSPWSSGNKGSMKVVSDSGLKTKVLRCQDVVWGSASRKVPVKPGEMYLIRGKARSIGGAFPTLGLFWTSGKEKVQRVNPPLGMFSGKDGSGWSESSLTVFIPDDVDGMNVFFGMRSRGHGACADFDDLEVFRID